MKQDIYKHSGSPTQEYQCVIEGNGNCVWMYLHHVAGKSVVSDAPVCSLTEIIDLNEFKKTYQKGETPPLVKEYCTEKALIQNLTNDRLSITWSADNTSVVTLIDNEPFAMILNSEKEGYSKATVKDGPWGKPWDDEKYKNKFG